MENLVETLLHRFAGAIDAGVFIHEGAQLAADGRRILGSLLAEQAAEDALFLRVCLALQNRAERGSGGKILRDLAAGDAAPDQALGGGVASQAVGAVHGVAGHLAGGPDVFHLGAAVDVGLDAAHRVVSHGTDGDLLGDGIDAQELHADFADQRQALVDPSAPRWVRSRWM